MNEKIPMSLLAEKLAVDKGCSPEEAENLLKTVFSLVGKSLIETGRAEFPALGNFSATGISDQPVVFKATESWSSTINAPFSIFSFEEIPSSVDLDELGKVGEEILDEPSIEPEQKEDTVKNEEPIKQDEVTVIEPLPAETPSETTEESPSNDEEPEKIVTGTAENKEEQTTKPSEDSPEHEVSEEGTEWMDNAEVDSNTGFGKGFIIGLIVGLAIGALALCCYVFYYVNSDQDLRHENTEEVLDETHIPDMAY